MFYYRVPEFWRKVEKLSFLSQRKNLRNIEWTELNPDKNNVWLTEGLQAEFAEFLPLGTEEVKSASNITGVSVGQAMLKIYSRGAETTRDTWMYDFNAQELATKASNMIETYNAELSR